MKKLLFFLSFAFLATWVFGQDAYLGSAKPDNFHAPVINQNSGNYAPNLTCPPGALNENEPDLQDDDSDTVDGGCNSNPPVFIDINIGDTYCGRTNTYKVSGNNSRDTDWYRIVLTETKTLVWRSTADCPINLFIIQENGGCNVTLLANETEIPAGTTGEVEYTCAPGTYYFWIGLPVYDGWDNGADYQATLLQQSTAVPVSDWAVYIALFLIVAFSAFYYRRRLA